MRYSKFTGDVLPERPCLFRYEDLRAGDIVLTRDGGLKSRLIRAGSRGDFSHALICTKPPTLIEALGSGVQNISARNCYVSEKGNICVLRLKSSIPDSDKISMSAGANAAAYFATAYDMPQAIASVANITLDEDDQRVFCSELVAKAYAQAGIFLVPGKSPDHVTPGLIASSEQLEVITDHICYYCDDSSSVENMEAIDGERGTNPARETSLEMTRIFEITSATWDPYLSLYLGARPRNLFDVVFLIGGGASKIPTDLEQVRQIDDVLFQAIAESRLWTLLQQAVAIDGASTGQQLAQARRQLNEAGSDLEQVKTIVRGLLADVKLIEGQVEDRLGATIEFERLANAGGMKSPAGMAKFQRLLIAVYEMRKKVLLSLVTEIDEMYR